MQWALAIGLVGGNQPTMWPALAVPFPTLLTCEYVVLVGLGSPLPYPQAISFISCIASNEIRNKRSPQSAISGAEEGKNEERGGDAYALHLCMCIDQPTKAFFSYIPFGAALFPFPHIFPTAQQQHPLAFLPLPLPLHLPRVVFVLRPSPSLSSSHHHHRH
jgi:hypothetical protein